jgi:hypothetical protein
LKSSWPLPAQGRLWPIKAGEKDEWRGGNTGRKTRQRGEEDKEEKQRGRKKNGEAEWRKEGES